MHDLNFIMENKEYVAEYENMNSDNLRHHITRSVFMFPFTLTNSSSIL